MLGLRSLSPRTQAKNLKSFGVFSGTLSKLYDILNQQYYLIYKLSEYYHYNKNLTFEKYTEYINQPLRYRAGG